MKLLMYGVNKETVMKEDVEKYLLLNEAKKKTQMNDIAQFKGVDEIVVLTNDFRNEYYLYVDETIFSHGEFLRYLAEKTDKTLQDVILETYSKFNEDVLRHLFEVTCGYLANPTGAFQVLGTVEEALGFANRLQTSGPVVYKMFNTAIYLAYSLKLQHDIRPLNCSPIAKYIYLLKDQMNELEKKNYLISGDDLQVYFLTKTLLYAGAQSITIIQNDEFESQRQFERIKMTLNELELSKVFPVNSKSLYYRLSKSDAAILNSSTIDLFKERIWEEVSIIRQTKKVQYLVDTSESPLEIFNVPNLDLEYIDGTVNLSYNEEEKNEAIVAFDESLTNQIEEFMTFLQKEQVSETKEVSY